jgi:hypothetical protein
LAGLGGLIVVALVAAMVVADDSTGDLDDRSGRPVESAAVGDLRTVDLGPFTQGESIPVTIAPGDVSFLLTATADDADEPLAVVGVRDPDGEIIYAADNALVEASGGLTTHVRQSQVATGEVSIIAPAHPGLDVRPGVYQVAIDNVAPVDVSVVIKSGDDIDTIAQVIDVNIWSASTAFDAATLQAGLREGMDVVLGPHGLEVGEITVTAASAGDIEAHARTRVERLEEVCEAVAADIGTTRALNLAVVETLSDDLAGIASGLPGAIEDPEAKATCVVAATGVGTQRFPMANIASTVVHEASHFLGLTHTTEEDGTLSDDFNDTAACDLATQDGRDNLGYPGDEDGALTAEECGLEGGADNYMFFEDPYPDIRDVLTQVVMSPDQAWALRRHPLFRPSS